MSWDRLVVGTAPPPPAYRVGGLVSVSVGRCLGVYARAYMCCCGAFLIAYRMLAHRTRVSLALFYFLR
jgi:hypothetical protein